MLAIFALLALSQGSYVRPFLVMAIIPFGLVGVVLAARGKSHHGIRPSLHPGGLRCDSGTYSRYAPESRLVRRAQERARCSRDFCHGLLGHYVLGVPISAASFMGFFGLSGVTINDSLIMKDLIDQRRREGADVKTAIIDGAKRRFRPIILTSVTTFLGFTPLILERAIQAQFLVPFAASLGVGIMITTGILLLLVPALLAVNLRANSRHRAAGAVPVP